MEQCAFQLIRLPVRDIQCDELWGYVQRKEKTKTRKGLTSEKFGDAYCSAAIERDSKLILSCHLGGRSAADTNLFTEKLDKATEGKFQITTDGFGPYRDAIGFTLDGRTDFAQLVKIHGEMQDEHWSSPAKVLGAKPDPQHGRPDPDRICTSHVERQNLTIIMTMRRLTRLTNGFSKKWENLRAAYALHFAYYNFCRIHSSIRCTPAMEAGITKGVWTISRPTHGITPACYCDASLVEIAKRLHDDRLPLDMLKNRCCWKKICRANARLPVTKEKWRELCRRRGRTHFAH